MLGKHELRLINISLKAAWSGKASWESPRETGRQREFENLQRSENPGRSQWESFPFAGNMKFPRRLRSGLWPNWTGFNINIDIRCKTYCFSLLLLVQQHPTNVQVGPSWCCLLAAVLNGHRWVDTVQDGATADMNNAVRQRTGPTNPTDPVRPGRNHQ